MTMSVRSRLIRAGSVSKIAHASDGVDAARTVYPARSSIRVASALTASSSSTRRMVAGAADGTCRPPARLAATSGGAVVGRQIHRHGGSVLRRRVDGHEAAGMVRDTLHERQAEPGALADLLRREERLEEMGLHVGAHADAVVAHAKPVIFAGSAGLFTREARGIDHRGIQQPRGWCRRAAARRAR